MKEIGRLTKKPELRHTTSGKAVCNFTIAVNIYKDITEFYDCETWENQAKYLTDYAEKGDFVCVDGMWRSKEYDYKINDKDTVKMKSWFIQVQKLVLPNYRKREEQDVEVAREKRGQTIKPKKLDTHTDPDLPF